MQTHFVGRAATYKQYRPKPPNELIDFLVKQIGLNQNKKLNYYLDLGCGTGQLTIPLSRYFTNTLGLDPAPDMLTEAQKAAQKNSCYNIKWINDYAENLSIHKIQPCDLITAMNSFHWMKHQIVVPLILDLLAPQKHFVMIGSYKLTEPDSNSNWQNTLMKIINHRVGQEKQTILGNAYNTKWDEIIKQYPFTGITSHEIPTQTMWNIENLLGCIFTISYCSEEKMGKERASALRQDLKNELLKLHPNNQFVQQYKISVIIAQK